MKLEFWSCLGVEFSYVQWIYPRGLWRTAIPASTMKAWFLDTSLESLSTYLQSMPHGSASFYQSDGPMIHFPSLHHVHYQARQPDCDENQDAPIEGFCSDWGGIGPETPEKHKYGVKQATDVDWDTEATKAPPGLG